MGAVQAAEGAPAKAAEAASGKDILEAARKGDLEAVDELLHLDPGNVEKRGGEYRNTALHLAAQFGHEAIVAALLRSRAAVDAANHVGCTALHLAADSGHEAIVAALLRSRAAVDAADCDGATPLWWAAANGRTAAMQLLLDARAAVDAADNNFGHTPLWTAARYGHATAVKLLLAAGAAEDRKDKEGKTPLDIALEYKNYKVVRVLRPVFVSLMSGRSARCASHQRVKGLLKEAEKKLEVKISQLVTADGTVLKGDMTLAEASLSEDGHVTAIAQADALPA